MLNGQLTLRQLTSAAIVVIIAVTCCAAPAALGRIIIGNGIAGITLSESEAQVRRHLGKPRYIQPPGWGYGAPLDGWVGFDYYHRVDEIWTTSKSQRTSRGVGPGASLTVLRRAYPHVQCYTNVPRKRLVCILQSHQHGHSVETEFFLTRKIDRIDILLLPAVPKRQPA
jgi:hypothetical protein